MTSSHTPVSGTQAAWLRMRRSGLVEPFESPEEAAAALIGIQAQLLPAAGLALWNRTAAERVEEIHDALFSRRTLVKLWGQRNTLHLYRSADWPLLHAAFEDRRSWFAIQFHKKGGDPEAFEAAIQLVAERMRRQGRLKRDDVREAELGLGEYAPLSWAGLLMSLVRRGMACHAERGPRGAAQLAPRETWLPDLQWNPPAPDSANIELARRYLRAYGPARPRDLAFWHGAKVAGAQRWLAALGDEVAEIDLEGETWLALRSDLVELTVDPPPAEEWPVRLLYRFDPMLLALKDKSWLVDEHHYKRIWRPAGHVEGVLLVRGRIAGTWRYNRRANDLDVTIDPFSKLEKSVRAAVEEQASGVAGFFGLALGGVAIPEG